MHPSWSQQLLRLIIFKSENSLNRRIDLGQSDICMFRDCSRVEESRDVVES